MDEKNNSVKYQIDDLFELPKINGQELSINNHDLIRRMNNRYNNFDFQELLFDKNVHYSGEFSDQLKILKNQAIISINFPIHSHRKWIGRFLINGKKVARIFLKWLVLPMMEQQTLWNQKANEVISGLTQQIELLDDRVKELEFQLEKESEKGREVTVS